MTRTTIRRCAVVLCAIAFLDYSGCSRAASDSSRTISSSTVDSLHPAQLVGRWSPNEYPAGTLPKGWRPAELLLESNGSAIHRYYGQYGRLANFKPKVAQGTAVEDTMTWVLSLSSANWAPSPAICFSGPLIGQRNCVKVTQQSADQIALNNMDPYEHYYTRVTAAPAPTAADRSNSGSAAVRQWALDSAFFSYMRTVSPTASGVQRLLESGVNPNAQDGNLGRTALATAMRSGDTGIVKLLIAAGAEVNAKADGLPQWWEASNEVLPVLLESGASVSARAPDGRTLLHYSGRDTLRMRLLLEHGLDVNLRDNAQQTVLGKYEAERSGDATELSSAQKAGNSSEAGRLSRVIADLDRTIEFLRARGATR